MYISMKNRYYLVHRACGRGTLPIKFCVSTLPILRSVKIFCIKRFNETRSIIVKFYICCYKLNCKAVVSVIVLVIFFHGRFYGKVPRYRYSEGLIVHRMVHYSSCAPDAATNLPCVELVLAWWLVWSNCTLPCSIAGCRSPLRGGWGRMRVLRMEYYRAEHRCRPHSFPRRMLPLISWITINWYYSCSTVF